MSKVNTGANRGPENSNPLSVTAESNKRTMGRLTHECLTNGDAAQAEEFLSLDIVLHFAGQQRRGRTRISPSSQGIATLSRASGRWRRWWLTATPWRCATPGRERSGSFAGVPPTHRPVVVQSIAFYRLADGKIVEELAQLDMLGVLQQNDAVPGA
jgi:hypothetical protein